MTAAASAPRQWPCPRQGSTRERRRRAAGTALPLPLRARVSSLRPRAPPALLRARRPTLDAPRDREGLSFLPAAAAHHPWPVVAGHAAMKIFERLRHRSPHGEVGAPDSAVASTSLSRRAPAMNSGRRQSPFDRVDAARDERN